MFVLMPKKPAHTKFTFLTSNETKKSSNKKRGDFQVPRSKKCTAEPDPRPNQHTHKHKYPKIYAIDGTMERFNGMDDVLTVKTGSWGGVYKWNMEMRNFEAF